MMKKKTAQFGTMIAAVTMILSLLIQMLIPLRAEAASSIGRVTFSVERFTLGQGFFVEPVEVEIYEGDTGYDLLMRAIPDAKRVLHFNGQNSYLEWIEGADEGLDKIKVPDYIFDLSGPEMTMETIKETGNEYDRNGLGEFSYSQWSGWMYSVNHEFPKYGLDSYHPQNGDVVRWQFTLYGTGLDVEGKGFGETEPRVDISNKDEAMKLLAKINGNRTLLDDPSVKWAYDQLMTLVQNPIAKEETVKQNVSLLNAAMEGKGGIFPEKIELDLHEKEIYTDGGSFKLNVTLTPADVILNQIQWNSSAPDIAQVDEDGTVTPLKGGTAVITAETGNGLKAECQVNVKERPITAVKLKPEALQMVNGASVEIRAVITPDNTTDSKTLTWKSSAEEIAVVENGVVTAKAPGEVDITAVSVNGMSGTCHVTVVEDYDKLLKDLKDAIKKLPEAGQLTLDDESAVINAQTIYDNLPKAYQDQLSTEERTKLEACSKVINALKDDQEKVQAFSEKLNAILSIDQITVGDNQAVKDLVDIVNTWNSLTTRQQDMVEAPVKEKYEQCRQKTEELKKAVDAINQQLLELKGLVEAPEKFNLGNISQVTKARSAYNTLCPYLMDIEAGKAGWIDPEGAAILIQAEKLTRSLFVEEIQALNPDDDASVSRFIHAMKLYEAMPGDQRPLFNEDVMDQMNAGRTAIEAKAHKSEAVTVTGESLPWYVRIYVKAVEADSSLNEGISALYGKGSTLRKAYAVSFEDIETGKPFVPENPLVIRLSEKLQGDEQAENFSIFRQEPDGLKAGLIGKAMKSAALADIEGPVYDSQTGIWEFTAQAPCTFGLVYKFIPLTGVTIEAPVTELEEGSSTTLSVKPNPENATLGDKGLQVTWSSSDASVVSVSDKGDIQGLKAGQSAVITATVKDQPKIKADVKITVKTAAATEALRGSLNPSLSQMLQETANYIVDTELSMEGKQPGSIGYGSQWNVFGIARSRDIAASAGMDTTKWDSFIKTFYNNTAGQYKKDGGRIPSGDRKRTEYSKFILTLTACGYDAREVSEEKYNVFDHLRDFKKVRSQGINGPIWALIALKSSAQYEGVLPITEAEAAKTGIAEPTSEERLLNTVLDTQLPGGGWTLFGEIADSDLTGMALQALWPYYAKPDSEKTAFEKSASARVNTAVNRALTCLKEMQMESGGFGSRSGGPLQETSESIAQVVTGLTGLNIDPADARNGFVKPGSQWMMSALTRYYVSGGGFMHLLAGSGDDGGAKPGQRDGMATEQGFYTLIAYQRLVNHKNGLYNMNDEKIQGGQAASGGVAGGRDQGQNAGGNKGAAKGNIGGQKSAVGQQKSGWNFDTTMAATDRAALGGFDEVQLRNASMLLGFSGAAIMGVFLIVRIIYSLYIKS